MSLSEVMLKTLIPSNFLDSDDEEIKSLTCPPETDDLQRNEFHMFNDYFGLSNLVQRVRQANGSDFDYLTGENFGVSKLPPRRDRFDSIDSENSSSGSCDSFTDHFGDGPFQPFNSSSLLHSASSKRKEAVLPPSRRIKPSARAPAPVSNRQNVCVFCRNNGESEEVFSSHQLKGPDGKTTCPILRAYTCPICKASGDESHTIKYCPQNQQAQGNGGQLPKVPRNRVLPKRSRWTFYADSKVRLVKSLCKDFKGKFRVYMPILNLYSGCCVCLPHGSLTISKTACSGATIRVT